MEHIERMGAKIRAERAPSGHVLEEGVLAVGQVHKGRVVALSLDVGRCPPLLLNERGELGRLPLIEPVRVKMHPADCRKHQGEEGQDGDLAGDVLGLVALVEDEGTDDVAV